MRWLVFIGLLCLPGNDPVKLDTVTGVSFRMQVMQQDVDSIQIMIKELKRSLNIPFDTIRMDTVKIDTIVKH